MPALSHLSQHISLFFKIVRSSSMMIDVTLYQCVFSKRASGGVLLAENNYSFLDSMFSVAMAIGYTVVRPYNT